MTKLEQIELAFRRAAARPQGSLAFYQLAGQLMPEPEKPAQLYLQKLAEELKQIIEDKGERNVKASNEN